MVCHFFFKFIFEKERKRERERTGEGQREEDRESQAGSTVSAEPDAGLQLATRERTVRS